MAPHLLTRLPAVSIFVAAATSAQAARIDLVRLTAGQPDFHTCGIAVPPGPPLTINPASYSCIEAGTSETWNGVKGLFRCDRGDTRRMRAIRSHGRSGRRGTGPSITTAG